MKNYVINMNQYGENKIGARIIGIEILSKTKEILESSIETKVTFDFEGIDYISSGFAKELFGGLFYYLGREFNTKISIKIPNENKIIKEIIIKALRTQ